MPKKSLQKDVVCFNKFAPSLNAKPSQNKTPAKYILSGGFL